MTKHDTNARAAESRSLWCEELGERADDVWDALNVEQAPDTLSTRGFTYWLPWQRATAASVALSIALNSILGIVTWQQHRFIQEQAVDYALLQLQSPRAATRLDALFTLRSFTQDITRDHLLALRGALVETQDPNVQLAILELLIDTQIVTRLSELPALPPDKAPQQRLLEASFTTWHTSTGPAPDLFE